ncbi:NTPase KAP family P-loop domain-containing protein 1-like [Leptodactylus fuscus]|uniref:NTPase KAP family P-loop domain-containing protein 1-like n=1 Tax=Leptodactylus fuscus TaxID=238119 RepID=UPI003F4E46AD
MSPSWLKLDPEKAEVLVTGGIRFSRQSHSLYRDDMVYPGFKTKDDVYCYSLAKALYYVVTPVTVGFYAPWGRRKDFLLNKIEAYLCREGRKKDREEVKRTGQQTRKPIGKDLIKLIFLMIFYYPTITEKHKRRENIHYCFIRFSAWEYAGSDQLWAGLVTALCDGIENCFGLTPISVFRAVGRAPEDDPFKQEWVSKKILCIPLWLASLLVFFIGIVLGVLMLIYGISFSDPTGDLLAAAEGVGAAIVGVSAAGALRVAIVVICNAIVTQKRKVEQKMNRTDMSSQLGFMSDVKLEVKIITRYLQLMEVFQRQKIKVVLEITNLDKCMPDKVVGVLNAMNILLSDPNAPFISILAVDPRIIIDCVESSVLLKGMANNGYEFLNRIITLPFSIPKMDSETKLSLVKNIIEGEGEIITDLEEDKILDHEVSNEKDPLLCLKVNPNSDYNINDVPLAVRRSNTKTLLNEAFSYLFDKSMRDYITDNVVHIRRVINTITITIRLMISQVKISQIQPLKVTQWVLLATQWPCRLSWILQCMEDEEQMSEQGKWTESSSDSRTLLWDVFEKSLEELDTIKTSLKNLLELDGDPEIFHSLCHQFTVEEANFYLQFTVNLDSSIKRQMELLRGSNNMWESKKRNRLTMRSLLNMSVNEVCKEMSKLGFEEENLQVYKRNIRKHNLNGRALVYSDNNEIKSAMCMGLGDWTLFSVYFLGVLPAPPATPAPVIGTKQDILKERRLSTDITS